MKKRILSILAIMLVLIMALTSCGGLLGGGPTDKPIDPETPNDDSVDNTAALVETVNGAGTLEELLEDATESIEDAELPAVEDVLALLDEISFEADAKISGTMVGETPLEADVKINDRVVYFNVPNSGDGYIFLEDDLTLVAVQNGQGHVTTELKDAFGQLDSGTIEEVDLKALLEEQFGTQLTDMFYDYQLPEITPDDIEVKDGRYLLKRDYLNRIVDSVIDAIVDYSNEQGEEVPADEIKKAKDQIKEIVAGFNPTIGFLMENEEITGVYLKVDADEKALEEYVGDMDELFLEAEIGKNGVAIEFAFVNGYNDFKGDLDVALTYDEDGVLTKVDADLVFDMVNTASFDDGTYIYNEQYDFHEYVVNNRFEEKKNTKVTLDMTLDLTAVDNGGKVLGLAFTFENKTLSVEKFDFKTDKKVALTVEEQDRYLTGNSNISVTANADWTATKNGTSALVFDLKQVRDTDAAQILKAELDIKHSSDMTPPESVVKTKNDALAGGGGSDVVDPPVGGGDDVDPPVTGETYYITIWVSEVDGMAELTQAQIERFLDEHPEISINVAIECVGEWNAGGMVLADVASAPDIFCFSQEYTSRLVQAGALSALGVSASETVRANNDAASVAATTVNGTLYAYPMTSDNGYYLYYDTSIISPEDADSLEAIIAACEANGKEFRFGLENAWYTASFFFATGCTVNPVFNEDGEVASYSDTFNSPEGIIAMKGMMKLAQSSCYNCDNDIFSNAGAIVTGLWNANYAQEHFGENLGVTDLPSFTVDGQSYHLGSFSGHKLMGVKPQSDPDKAAVLHLLAEYLTNEECQLERYEMYMWGPSNINAQQSDAVLSDPSLAALFKQSAYAVPQPNMPGAWWDIARILGSDAKNITSDADIQASLDNYSDIIGTSINTNYDDYINAWTVIGAVNGTMWDVDFSMTEISDGVWETVGILDLNAGDQFKFRRGCCWDSQIGADGAVMINFNVPDPPNIVVEVTGAYKIRFEWDGVSSHASISYIPQ